MITEKELKLITDLEEEARTMFIRKLDELYPRIEGDEDRAQLRHSIIRSAICSIMANYIVGAVPHEFRDDSVKEMAEFVIDAIHSTEAQMADAYRERMQKNQKSKFN